MCYNNFIYIIFFFFFAARARGDSLATVCGFLIAMASPVVEHRLQGAWASEAVACEHSSCSSRALGHRLNSCGTGV